MSRVAAQCLAGNGMKDTPNSAGIDSVRMP